MSIEKTKTNGNYKMSADGEDREAIYSLSESATAHVATAIDMKIQTTFLDMVESAIEAGKQNELFMAIVDNGKSEFFWMNMDQIDRFLVGKETPAPLADD